MILKKSDAVAIFAVLVLCLNFSSRVHAEAFVANWINTTGRYTFKNNIFVFGELQLRSTRDSYHFNMFVANGGIGYRLTPGHAFSVFTGKFITFANDEFFGEPLRTNETRLSEQWAGTHKLWNINWEHRIRAEQRWISGTYRNRFRYRLQSLIPLGQASDKTAIWNIVLYDEVFFSDTAPEFARNRSYVGVRHPFSKIFTVQPGVLYEFDPRNGQSDLHTLYLQFNLMFDFREGDSAN